MVLLYFEKDGTIKAATIQKPDIIPRVTEVLGTAYKPELAECYAKKVADFFVTKMRFPEDGIYRLNGEGKLCRFNLKKKEWNQNGDETSKYVINESSDFWKEFDKEFPYLLSSRKELVSMVEEQTIKMFEISPDIDCSIRFDGNQFYTDKGIIHAFNAIISEYCTEETTQAMMSEFLQEVFGTKSIPVFVIFDNDSQIILTKSSVVTDKIWGTIKEFLSKHFSKEDVEKIFVNAKNYILFGLDYNKYEIIKVFDNEYWWHTVTYSIMSKVAGLYVKLSKSSEFSNGNDDSMVYMGLIENEENRKTIDSFKFLKEYRETKFYEAYEHGRKIFISLDYHGDSTRMEISYKPFEELNEEPD